MKQLLLRPFFRLFVRDLNAPAYEVPPLVVLGMPRSGTSLLSRLVEACGVTFGDETLLRPKDIRNPDGFLELVEMNRIDDRLVHESGFASHLCAEAGYGLRAQKGFRMSRFFTLRRMGRLMRRLSDRSTGKPWGFKQTPFTFYWWKRFTPRARIIAIYRDPRTNAESIHRTFGRFTFAQALDWWTRGNTELLFHLSQHDSLLVKFEDLADVEKRGDVLARIAAFCGGDVAQLEALLEGEKNRERGNTKDLTPIPLSPDVLHVQNALDAVRG